MDSSLPCIVRYPQFTDDRGTLSVLDCLHDIPFSVKRVFFIDDMQVGITRGEHAHRQTKELIIAVRGSLDIALESGRGSERYLLKEPSMALYIPEMHWLTLTCLDKGTICLVLASTTYDETAYIRSHQEFRRLLAE